MSEINDSIADKLKVYPPGVAKLAIEAIRLSETLPESSVAEQLQNVVRNLVREELTDDPA